MKKPIAIGAVCAVALGLAACTPPADEVAEAPAEEAVAPIEEAPAAEGAMDGTMTGEAVAEEGEGDGGDTTGPDEDGNPIHN